jgi:MoaD family protein
MIIKIRLFTVLREIANKKEETLTFSNDQAISIKTVLERLDEKYGKEFYNYVYEPKTGQVKGFLQFLVNGITAINGLETKLKDGDLLAILPPIGGG